MGTYYTKESQAEVRESCRVEDVLSSYGVELKPSPKGFKCKCPIDDHSGSSLPFEVYTDSNTWRCHACGDGGDAIKLIMQLEGYSRADFPLAIEKAASIAGVELVDKNAGKEARREKRANARADRFFRMPKGEMTEAQREMLRNRIADRHKEEIERTRAKLEEKYAHHPNRDQIVEDRIARKVEKIQEATEAYAARKRESVDDPMERAKKSVRPRKGEKREDYKRRVKAAMEAEKQVQIKEDIKESRKMFGQQGNERPSRSGEVVKKVVDIKTYLSFRQPHELDEYANKYVDLHGLTIDDIEQFEADVDEARFLAEENRKDRRTVEKAMGKDPGKSGPAPTVSPEEGRAYRAAKIAQMRAERAAAEAEVEPEAEVEEQEAKVEAATEEKPRETEKKPKEAAVEKETTPEDGKSAKRPQQQTARQRPYYPRPSHPRPKKDPKDYDDANRVRFGAFKDFEAEPLGGAGRPEQTRKTIVINLLGGPGSGKTTAAMQICSILKSEGFEARYVSEYAKDVLAAGRGDELVKGSLAMQQEIFMKQTERIDAQYGQVDFVVTDSPTILSACYLKDGGPDAAAFVSAAIADYRSRENFTAFIDRDPSPFSFEQEGRVQDYEQALAMDEKILGFLKEHRHEIGCGRYKTNFAEGRTPAALIAKNSMALLSRIEGKTLDELRNPSFVWRSLAVSARDSFEMGASSGKVPQELSQECSQAAFATIEKAYVENLPIQAARAIVDAFQEGTPSSLARIQEIVPSAKEELKTVKEAFAKAAQEKAQAVQRSVPSVQQHRTMATAR